MGSCINTELVIQSIAMAVERKRSRPRLTHCFDWGKQYCSRDHEKLLSQFYMKVSMSRKGNGFRPASDTYLVQPMNGNTTERAARHEEYWCPILTSRVSIFLSLRNHEVLRAAIENLIFDKNLYQKIADWPK